MHINEKRYYVLALLLLLLTSCNSKTKRENYYNSFDLPLIRESRNLYFSGDYDGYIALQKKYMKIADREGYKDGKAICYINLSRLNTSSKDKTNRLFFLQKAEEIIATSKDHFHKAFLYDAYASVSSKVNIYNKALYYNNKALDEINKTDSENAKKYMLSILYMRRGSYLYSKEKYDSAFSYLYKSRELEKGIAIQSVICGFHLGLDRLDSTRVCLDRAKKQIMLSGEKKVPAALVSSIYVTEGDYLMSLKQYNQAETSYLKALKFYDTKIRTYQPTEVYEALQLYYKETGNIEQARLYENKFNQMNLQIEENNKKVLEPTVNKILENIKNDRTKDRKYLWFIVLLIVFTSILALAYAYKKGRLVWLKKKKLVNEIAFLEENSENKKYNEMIGLARKNDPNFISVFKEVYPDFITKLQQINPGLENSELIFAALIRLNFSAKEIASSLSIQHSSVQQRKRRLRKRLYLSSEIDLYKFFSELR
ncbi:hypothetical protein [Elizabethkingia occulta]|uniref:hypothetical protein n=1 Tax=Elizabethkingia occulta TaxID=1867263 RepID=UPI00398C6AA6